MTKKYRAFTHLLDEMLKDPKFAAEFLSDALAEDFELFCLSLKDVIRVHGSIAAIAEKANVSRGTLYNLFSEKGNPELKTILAVLHALGYDLKVMKKQSEENSSL